MHYMYLLYFHLKPRYVPVQNLKAVSIMYVAIALSFTDVYLGLFIMFCINKTGEEFLCLQGCDENTTFII